MIIDDDFAHTQEDKALLALMRPEIDELCARLEADLSERDALALWTAFVKIVLVGWRSGAAAMAGPRRVTLDDGQVVEIVLEPTIAEMPDWDPWRDQADT